MIAALLLFAGLEFLLWWFLELHYWLIPAVFSINIFGTLIIANKILIPFMILPYQQPFVVGHITRQLNE